MQISDYLWQRARPESKRSTRHRRRPHKNKINYKLPSETPELGPKQAVQPATRSTPAATQATGPVRRPHRIRVRVDYRDIDTGARVAQPTIIAGLPGSKLVLNYPPIADWIFVRALGFQPTFPHHRKSIVLYYERIAGAPVIVFHRDQDGQLLCPAERINGKLGAEYTVKPLNYFAAMVVGASTATGTFTKRIRVVTFRYQVVPITPLHLPNVAYIELLTDKPVFDAPAGVLPLPVLLPQGTFWRVFEAVQTTTDHKVWLSLGGAQWLTNDNTRGHQQNPFLPR